MACIALALTATPAWANAGTPMIWLEVYHLFFGNAAIGIVEGAILALVFRVRMLPAVAWMIAANYGSMVLGLSVLPRVYGLFVETVFVDRDRLFAAPDALTATWCAAVVGTILVELPGVFLALWQGKGPWRPFIGRAAAGAILVHAVSYSCIIPAYHRAGTTSLHSRFEGEESPGGLDAGVRGWVYSIDQSAGAVRRTRLDGSATELVAPIEESWHLARLVPREPDAGGWEVWAVLDDRGEERVLIGAGAPGRCGTQEFAGDSSPWMQGYRWTIDLQREPVWEAKCGFWPLEGLTFKPAGETSPSERMAYETLFDKWPVRFVTLLPEGLAVCQLLVENGEARNGWILIIDLERRRWAPLCRGSSPVVVLDDEGEEAVAP